MKLWSKLRGKPKTPPDPVAELDRVLAEMQAARDEARVRVAAVTGPERDSLERSLVQLELKIEAFIKKRNELVARLQR